MAQIGPHSRLLSRGSIDGRSRSGRFMRAYEAQLVAHIGGRPSSTQQFLIRQLVVLALRCALNAGRGTEMREDHNHKKPDTSAATAASHCTIAFIEFLPS